MREKEESNKNINLEKLNMNFQNGNYLKYNEVKNVNIPVYTRQNSVKDVSQRNSVDPNHRYTLNNT